jgi:hypothetical protein
VCHGYRSYILGGNVDTWFTGESLVCQSNVSICISTPYTSLSYKRLSRVNVALEIPDDLIGSAGSDESQMQTIGLNQEQ